jgi:hypothetical protein
MVSSPGPRPPKSAAPTTAANWNMKNGPAKGPAESCVTISPPVAASSAPAYPRIVAVARGARGGILCPKGTLYLGAHRVARGSRTGKTAATTPSAADLRGAPQLASPVGPGDRCGSIADHSASVGS